MELGLRDKRALVLGSSTGLGRAIAEELIAEGARVALCSRDTERLERARAETGAELAVQADLALPGEGARVVQSVIRAWEGLDILVTNTGGPPTGRFPQVSDDHWRIGFQGIFLSAVDAIQAALPGMTAQRWGRILMITSISAKEPLAGLTVSNGLRAGLLGLAKSLSAEVAPAGVTVNALLPGYTRTERLQELGVPESQLVSRVPAARLGEPGELAAMAAFLASERAAYVTGQAIAVDGGFLKGIF